MDIQCLLMTHYLRGIRIPRSFLQDFPSAGTSINAIGKAVEKAALSFPACTKGSIGGYLIGENEGYIASLTIFDLEAVDKSTYLDSNNQLEFSCIIKENLSFGKWNEKFLKSRYCCVASLS